MKKLYKRLNAIRIVASLFAMAALCLAQGVQAQPGITVKGEVLDSEGQGVVGVAVVVVGTQRGTTTDVKGAFTVKVASPDATLRFSSLGYENRTVKLNGRNFIRVTLENAETLIDDVVVVGYGTTRKSDLTGSVASVKAADFEDRAILSIEDAIRGKVAGVAVTSSDGQPGEAMNIRIRGTGSLNASNAPLYVVDGVPMEELNVGPGEIASMEILKDASATSIYGSRGANGVVLISTKMGKAGKATVTADVTIGYQTPVNLIKMMNSVQYAEHRYMQGRIITQSVADFVPNASRVGYYDREGNIWTFAREGYWTDYKKWGMKGATDTDWQDIMLRNTLIQDYRVNISGGDAKNRYSIMGNVVNHEGIVINSGSKRYSIRANYNATISKKLSVAFNVSAFRQENTGAITNDVRGTTMNMLQQMPTKAVNYTPDLVSEQGEDNVVNRNPWFQAMYCVRKNLRDNILGKFSFKWDFAKDFYFNISASYNVINTRNDRYNPASSPQGNVTNGYAETSDGKTDSWLNENLVYWKPKPFGRHKIDVMAGLTFQETQFRETFASVQNFGNEVLKEMGFKDALTAAIPTRNYSRTRMASWLARANYTYDERYLFTVAVRGDGSSRFGADNKWAVFPSGAFAWRISQEGFMKNVRSVSNLKLRASAGMSGNTAIPAYQTLPMLSISNYPMDGLQDYAYGVRLDRIANPHLKWEKSVQYDLGLDLGMFKNRLEVVVDAYYKRTSDLLLLEPIPAYTGFTTWWSNRGKVDNKGLEISVNARPVQTRKVSWNINFNMAFNRSKVVYIGESGEMILSGQGVASNYAILKEGLPIGQFYGYVTDGIYRSYGEINSLPDGYNVFSLNKEEIMPGRMKYVDQNGDNSINDADRVILGCAEPVFTGGFQNSVSYKNFTLTAFLEYSYGGKIFNATALNLERGAVADNYTERWFRNRWMPTLYDMKTGEVVHQGNEENSWLPSMGFFDPQENYRKDIYVEDGSYLRIADVTLSYTIPTRLVKRIGMKNIRVALSVKNLHTFTSYSGYDPDVNSVTGGYADLIPRVDNGSYPRTRVYSASLNISF